MSFWDAFARLPRPSAPGYFSVESGGQRVRAGRSYENHPALLIEFTDTGGAAAPRRLANIAYTPPAVVDLASTDGKQHRARLAILECRTLDSELAAYFFRIAGAVLVENTANTELEFETALDALITLFRSLQRPGTRTTIGLWAELAVIFWAPDPLVALSAWHSSPHALHDFSAGSYRLEVKATMKALREHTFLLDQLSTLQPGVTLVASLVLHESETGSSVFDIVDAIEARIGGLADPSSRLETIVADSLGDGWREATDLRFALGAARQNLQLYAADDIPTIPQPLPAAVKEVRFLVDLSGVEQLSFSRARSLGPLFERMVPEDGPTP